MHDRVPLCARAGRARRVSTPASRRCVTQANGCDEIESCLAPRASSRGVCRRGLCARRGVWDLRRGRLYDQVDEVLRELSASGISCLIESLGASCDADVYSCFSQGEAASAEDCDQYCFIASTCGGLPDDQSEFDCVEECNMLAADSSSGGFETYAARLACVEVASCGFDACLSGAGGSDQCSDLCVARGGAARRSGRVLDALRFALQHRAWATRARMWSAAHM